MAALVRAWPLPALLVWLSAWAWWWGLQRLGAPAWCAWAAPMGWSVLCGLALAWRAPQDMTRWRTWFTVLGFPLSALLLLGDAGPAHVPPWAWLGLLAIVWLAYPRKAWRDAPVYPTPQGALQGLAQHVSLPAGARILDVGCGLGHGLQALHGAFPQARCEGVEWSRPLSLLCRWRCPWAQVFQGDMWAHDWSGYDLVYVFQRPESMPRIWAHATQHMKPGAWLVSLAFDVPGVQPQARLGANAPGSPHTAWVYRVGK